MNNCNGQIPRSESQNDAKYPSFVSRGKDQSRQANHSSSCSSLTSGIGQSDQSISNDSRLISSSSTLVNGGRDESKQTKFLSPGIDLQNADPQLKSDLKNFVDIIFTDSQSISLKRKSEFGQLVRRPEARLLFAMFVDEYRVNSKRVCELTFYSLAQYFSIVLLECLLAEDFRPAKIIMNMMFTYYYEPSNEKVSPKKQNHSTDHIDGSETPKTYLYTLLKDQQIFKSIRFWTSAFYESVIIERGNHSVFVDRGPGKLSNEKRNEEMDCSKNITFGLLGSFIHNMSLLDISQEFCEEFLDKHSTIADLSDDQLDMLRSNLRSMFEESSSRAKTTSPTPTSAGVKFSKFMQKLSLRLNQNQSHQ